MTINYKGVDFDVQFVKHRANDDFQGSPEWLEITSINHNGVDFFAILDNDLVEIEKRLKQWI